MVALLSAVSPVVASAKPTGSASTPTGIDISYPQCGKSLPSGQAFAVIGVNGGLANNYNACLGAQWTYATTQTVGGTSQARAQTYLNTGDPGNTVADWPNPRQPGNYPSTTSPYGACDWDSTGTVGANSNACAYLYGYDMVAGMTYSGGTVKGDLQAFTDATKQQLGAQPVWLDVETANSWQSGIAGQAMNVAALQGMVDAIRAAAPSSTIGIYSTSYQWGQITGTPNAATAGNLASLPVWIPGARSQSGATTNCGLKSFTSGPVEMTQWFGHPYDGNVSCN